MKSKFFLLIILVGVSLLFGLPHLLVPVILEGDKYSPLGGGSGPQPAIATEEVYTYASEVQEILEGKFPISDTQLVDYKNSPSPFSGETLPAVVMAVLSKLSGSVENSFMVADFFLPPITVWFLYKLSRRLGVGQGLSILTGVTTVTATKLIELVPYLRPTWDYLVGLKGSDDFLFFSRNFHPQFSFLLFLGMLLAIIDAMKIGDRKRIVIAGGLVGAQFYTYFFNWTTTIGMLAILLIWQIGLKDWKSVRHLAILSLIGFVFSFPYILEMTQFRTLPMYQNFFLKNSLPERSFISISIRYAILVGVVFWLTKGKQKIPLTVLMAVIVSTIILPEVANLILGRDPEGKHWIRRLLIPLAFPLAAVACELVYRKQTFFKLTKQSGYALFSIGLGVIFLFGVRVQISASEKYSHWFSRPADKQAIFDWFNANGYQGEVLATLDSGLIAEIPAFTKMDNAVPVTTRSIATTEESISRFLEVATLYQLSPDDISYLLWTGEISMDDPENLRRLEKIAPDSKGSWVSRIFYFTANDNGNIFSLSREKREAVIEEYGEELGAKYRIDYVLVGPFEKRILGEDIFSGRFREEYKNESYSVYRVKN